MDMQTYTHLGIITQEMDNLEQRLAKVFAIAFPGLPSERIREAFVSGPEGWDSIRAITLLTLIEEEFGIQMDFTEDVEHLTSFSSIAEYLKRKLAAVTVA
jgi:acyl carrier protein